MSILKRVRDLTLATINEGLDRMENPIAMLNQYLRDIEQEISEGEVALARQIAMERKVKSLLEETQNRMDKRVRQAQLAVDHGQDDVAKEAIADKQYCGQKMMEYQTQFDHLHCGTDTLRKQLHELKDKFYEMKNKKSALMARANVAKASKRMNTALSTLDTESAAEGFARVEERILAMEADAEASKYIRQTFAKPSNLYDPSVEEELNTIKGLKVELKKAD